MATLKVCDVCLAKGKLTPCKFRTGFTGLPKSEMCEEHRGYFKGMNRDQFLRESIKLSDEGHKAALAPV